MQRLTSLSLGVAGYNVSQFWMYQTAVAEPVQSGFGQSFVMHIEVWIGLLIA